jgi:hypothetical protein
MLLIVNGIFFWFRVGGQVRKSRLIFNVEKCLPVPERETVEGPGQKKGPPSVSLFFT